MNLKILFTFALFDCVIDPIMVEISTGLTKTTRLNLLGNILLTRKRDVSVTMFKSFTSKFNLFSYPSAKTKLYISMLFS